MEVTKKERGYVATGDEVRRSALRPVLLHYAIARHRENNGLRLLHVPLGSNEEALVVFSSWEAAQKYFLSEVFSGEWYTRDCYGGELVSLLLGPYEGKSGWCLTLFQGASPQGAPRQTSSAGSASWTTSCSRCP